MVCAIITFPVEDGVIVVVCGVTAAVCGGGGSCCIDEIGGNFSDIIVSVNSAWFCLLVIFSDELIWFNWSVNFVLLVIDFGIEEEDVVVEDEDDVCITSDVGIESDVNDGSSILLVVRVPLSGTAAVNSLESEGNTSCKTFPALSSGSPLISNDWRGGRMGGACNGNCDSGVDGDDITFFVCVYYLLLLFLLC